MQSLSAPRESGTDAGAVPPVFGPVSRQIFTDRYNQASFLFRHELDQHPLFKLPSLLELARRRPADSRHAYWSNGRVDVGQRWDARVAPRRSLEDTVEHIADNDSLAMLKHLEADAVFGPVIREICATVVELAGARMRRDVLEGRGTILIASPGRLTSYHIDSDTNYLFQIAGDKSLSVFDQLDRSLTTHEELERYYDGDPNGAVFKEERQREARVYELSPGWGVHIPSMAAHWACNHAQPSVALSINFDLRSVERLGRIYHFNCKLRRHGFKPRPPGSSALRDVLKLAALHGLGAAQRLTHHAAQHGKSQNS